MKNMIQRSLFLLIMGMLHQLSAAIPNSVIGIVDTSVSLFNNPDAIAITPDGKTAYVINALSNSVVIVDVASNAVTGSVTDSNFTFNDPYAIAITPNGQTAYVANQNNPYSISIINIATNRVVGTVVDQIPATLSKPTSIAITPDGSKAYVTNNSENQSSVYDVTIIDLTTGPNYNTVIGTVADTNLTFQSTQDVAITPNGQFAYVVNGIGGTSSSGCISVVDVATDTVIRVINDASFNIPCAIAITFDGLFAYVVNQFGNSVSIINTQTIAVEGVVTDVSTFNSPRGIAIAPNDTIAYVTNNQGNNLSIIDIKNDVVVGTITDASLNAPYAIAITPNGQTAYVTDISNNEVSIIYINQIVQAPGSMQVKSIINNFLTYPQYINVISWTACQAGFQAERYAIYRDAALTQLVAVVSADDLLQYYDYNREFYTIYSYYLVAIDTQNNVSLPISTTIRT